MRQFSRAGRPDEVSARELYLFITNDGDLYRQQHLPIIKNLAKKVGRGVYDKKLAVKLWMYLADEGARRYGREFGSGYSLKGFDKPTRFMVAAMLARDFMDKYRGKEYSDEVMALGKGRLINPAFRGGHLLSGGIDWATDVKHEGEPNEADIQWEKRRAEAAVMRLIGPDLSMWKAKTRFKFTGFKYDGVVWHYSTEQEQMPEDEQGEPTEPKWHYSLSFIGPAAMVMKVIKEFGGAWTPTKSNPARGLTRQGPACYTPGMASRNPRGKVNVFSFGNYNGIMWEDRTGYHLNIKKGGKTVYAGGFADLVDAENVIQRFRERVNPYTRVRFPAHSSRLFRSKKSGRWTHLPGRRRNPLDSAESEQMMGLAEHHLGKARSAKKGQKARYYMAGRAHGNLDAVTELPGSPERVRASARSIMRQADSVYANPRRTAGKLMSGRTLIGRKVLAVTYLDESKARRCGAKNPAIPWKHDFSTADARIYGLSDGSVLIKSDKKRLWGYR